MPSPELISGFAGGFAVGGGAVLGFMRIMIRSALTDLELRLTKQFDRRYVLLPQREER